LSLSNVKILEFTELSLPKITEIGTETLNRYSEYSLPELETSSREILIDDELLVKELSFNANVIVFAELDEGSIKSPTNCWVKF
jgi:hypothetical protein